LICIRYTIDNARR